VAEPPADLPAVQWQRITASDDSTLSCSWPAACSQPCKSVKRQTVCNNRVQPPCLLRHSLLCEPAASVIHPVSLTCLMNEQKSATLDAALSPWT
jgi:hypothetical protein